MERNDTSKLKELYEKYSGKKPPIQRLPSPATFETPANIHSQNEDQVFEEIQDKDDEKPKEKHVSLDQYLNSHTSQDNESFEELLIEAEMRHKEKYSFLYGEEEKTVSEQEKMLTLPSIEQQAKCCEKKPQLDMWGYKNKNYIMFTPDGVQLTKEEQAEVNKNRQEVVHTNTRLTVNPFNEVQSKETINELAKTQAKVLDGKIGVDGKELLKPDTPKVNGFSFVREPSPSPSLISSPLMTWGEIEGTPFRLDGGDTPLPRSQGPSFKISEPPRREQIALALAEKVGEKNRDQKKRNLDAQRRQLQSPRPNTSAVDRLSTMSPAARRLATARLKLGVNSDLMSTYSPSPQSRQLTPKTPKRVSTPLVKSKKAQPTTEVSTDDLLNISLPKRHRASDFF
ncbi:unnamed protein product [Acanthoscelides obtectus]|nr:unnamed protein product [Acanthoscelides obtectus]CAK1663713.1 Splicing factor ESS-2 homolog [Acanthoscelides obtectus]